MVTTASHLGFRITPFSAQPNQYERLVRIERYTEIMSINFFGNQEGLDEALWGERRKKISMKWRETGAATARASVRPESTTCYSGSPPLRSAFLIVVVIVVVIVIVIIFGMGMISIVLVIEEVLGRHEENFRMQSNLEREREARIFYLFL